MRAIVYILICFLGTAQAAEVLRVGASARVVAISHEPSRPWVVGDRVCIPQSGKEDVCGKVALSNPKHAVVKLDSISTTISRGNRVRSVAAKIEPLRRPAALMESNEKIEGAPRPLHNLAAGVSVGAGFYYPFLHFERLVTESLSIGLMPLYSNVTTNSGSITALGGYVTVSYCANEFFQGFWAQGGAGIHLLSYSSGNLEENSTSPAFLATAGWRGYWDLGINIGIAGGLQYFKDPDFSSVRLSGSSLAPLILLDVGFSF
jgi:hypothetical protein